MNNQTNQARISLSQILGLFSTIILMVSFYGSQYIILEKFGRTPFTILETFIIYITLILHIAAFSAMNRNRNNSDSKQ
jgi:uncharacterized membrane protein